MDQPQLWGDGEHDDAPAIQKMLDSGVSCVYLPPPAKCYLIQNTLWIHSCQELRLDRWSVIRLADHANVKMLANRNFDRGDRRIRVTGGIWDANNLGQKPNRMAERWLKNLPEHDEFGPGFSRLRSFGETMYFENVADFVLQNVTFRNPVTYAFHACKLSYFVIDEIEFDFTTWNPMQANMDGVHLDGGSHHGKISNLRGCCFDDMVALNANDGLCSACEDAVTDIDVDGIYCEFCHSAVRLLSTGADLRRITIRNIHGNFYRYAVGLTHFFEDRQTRGRFDRIVIADCFFAKARQPKDYPWPLAPYPPVFCDHKIDIGTLTVERVYRDESTEALPTILVSQGCRIANFVCRDCGTQNRLAEPVVFLQNDGKIDQLILENIQCEPVSGPGNVIRLGGNDAGVTSIPHPKQ